MGNRQGVVTGSKSIFIVDGVTLSVADIEEAAIKSAQNHGMWTFPIPMLNSANYKLKIKKLYNGNGAPAAHFVEACREFGLISEKECAEGLHHYSTRIHARHMKRLRGKSPGGGYKWKRERNNHIGKR